MRGRCSFCKVNGIPYIQLNRVQCKMRFRYIPWPCGRSFIKTIYDHGEGEFKEVPLYFKDFLNDRLGKYLIHKHQCQTSKFSYLRSAYIDIIHRAGPYLNYVLKQIRKIDTLIAEEFAETTVDSHLVLAVCDGETELRLITGEILFNSTDIVFCRLLFSCL